MFTNLSVSRWLSIIRFSCMKTVKGVGAECDVELGLDGRVLGREQQGGGVALAAQQLNKM